METSEPPSRVYPPADFRRRAIARAIDIAVACVPFLVSRHYRVASALVSGALLLCGDSLFGPGRSLGKRLAGLRTIYLPTRRPAGLRMTMQRNAIFVLAIIPALSGAPLLVSAAELCAILLLETFVALRPLTRDFGQRRFGDLLAGTQVIDGRLALGLELPALQPVAEPAAPLASRAARHTVHHEGVECASP